MADINPGYGLFFWDLQGRIIIKKVLGRELPGGKISVPSGPSPTFFPIGNTSTNCWDFLKPKLHARFLRDIPPNYPQIRIKFNPSKVG